MRSTYYDRFYAEGGWKFNYEKERALMSKLVEKAGLAPKASILELGCGQGFHSKLLHDLGFEVTGNELSEAGIAHAKANYPGPTFIQGDAKEVIEKWPPHSLDCVLVRGMSWFHYAFFDPARRDLPALMKIIASIIKPRGVFILTIVTDFSGTTRSSNTHNHEWADFDALLTQIGTIEHKEDIRGRTLNSPADIKPDGKGITCIVRLPS